jgi:RNA polymerase sigma-B factor
MAMSTRATVTRAALAGAGPGPHETDQSLARRHRHGDTRAREALIERYIPLARRLSRRYRHTSEPADDLFQVACLGLVKAVDGWEPDRGPAFSSYADPTILGELRRHFRDATWSVRPPRGLQELALSLEKARAELGGAIGRELAVDELAEHLGRSRKEIMGALEASACRQARSLDVPVYDEDERPVTAGDLIGRADRGYDRAEARATIDRLVRRLSEPARRILHLRFEHDLHQHEIAARVGCSKMQVSRTIRASLETLRLAA